MNVSKKCPVCSGEIRQTILYLNKSYADVPELQNLEIAVCNDCGFGMAFPERPWVVMQEFYKKLYRAEGSVHRGASCPLFSEHSVNSRALSQWMLLRTFRSFHLEDAFCDIGSGGVATFQTARFLGLNMKMFAYEQDEFSVELLTKQGISVFAECFHPHVELPPQKFSAVIISHVLEHFCASDAIGVLKKAMEMLLTDGVLLVEVPNTPMGSFGKMRLDDSPHLTFWTTASLAKAMKAAGLDVIFLSTAGERYQDWWKRAQEIVVRERPNSVRLLARFKSIFKGMLLSSCNPKFLTRATEIFWHIIRSKTIYEALSLTDFQYGQDRVYIRAIGCPSSFKTSD